MAVIFPDVEKTIVAYMKNALDTLATPLSSDVRVATRKALPTEPHYAKQLILNVIYNQERWYATKYATLTMEVFADDYETASALGLLVESLIRGVVGTDIKKVDVLVGPIRSSEQTEQEKRSLSVELVVKGSEL